MASNTERDQAILRKWGATAEGIIHRYEGKEVEVYSYGYGPSWRLTGKLRWSSQATISVRGKDVVSENKCAVNPQEVVFSMSDVIGFEFGPLSDNLRIFLLQS